MRVGKSKPGRSGIECVIIDAIRTPMERNKKIVIVSAVVLLVIAGGVLYVRLVTRPVLLEPAPGIAFIEGESQTPGPTTPGGVTVEPSNPAEATALPPVVEGTYTPLPTMPQVGTKNGDLRRVKVIIYRGYYLPVELLVKRTGESCYKSEKEFYGAAEDVEVAVDGSPVVDPAGCSYGIVESTPVIEINFNDKTGEITVVNP